MHRTFIYDLSCLISQQIYTTPSGTVRVDLRYAAYFLLEKAGTTVFVRQFKNNLVVVANDDAQALIAHLLEAWNVDPIKRGVSEQSDHNLSFRLEQYNLWEPDFDAFYSMPFTERFNYLMGQNLTNILGSEFSWADKLPFFVKVLYSFFSSLSKRLAIIYIHSAQFIGVYLYTNSFSAATKFIIEARRKRINLDDYIESNTDTKTPEQYFYICATPSHGFPFRPLAKLKDKVTLKYVVFIHDLLTIKFPEYFLPDSNQDQVAWFNALLELKPLLVTNSNTTREQIVAFANQYSQIINPVMTSYIGVEPHILRQKDSKKRKSEKPYFVIISTIEPRKNHLLLLNLWRELVLEGDIDTPELYLIGKRGWENENVIDMIERCQPLKGIVHELSDIRDKRLFYLLSGARALLYPSFGEGWGMPVAESLSLGTPVICSDIPELRESGQNIPEYISPIDGVKWKNTILKYCDDDSELRNQQLERIKQYNPPTWEDHFKLSLDGILES